MMEEQINKDVMWASETLNNIMESVNQYQRRHKREAFDELRNLYNDLLNIEIKKLRKHLNEEFYGIPNAYGVSDVISEVCNYYATTPDKLEFMSRRREVVYPKQLLHWMLKNRVVRNNLSLTQIGKLTGGQDHSTVLHSVKSISDRINTERDFREDVMQLCNKLGARTFWNGNRLEISHEITN